MERIMLLLLFSETAVFALNVSVQNNGPAVRGSNVTFTATVSEYSGESLKFVYRDDAQPIHSASFIEKTNTSQWIVEYPKEYYEARDYTVNLIVKRSYFGLWIIIGKSSTVFKLTDSLNGNLTLNQNNVDRPNRFVAVNKTVYHYVKLPDNEMELLKNKASNIVAFWFIDCLYIDLTSDLSLNYTYNDVMSDHFVDVLVVANNEILLPITTTTTTTIRTTTMKSEATLTTIPITKLPTFTLVNNDNTAKMIAKHMASATATQNNILPFEDSICHSNIVLREDHLTYGFYRQTVSVRETI